MLHLDAVSILPDDFLVKMDRASMAESLEVRLPFLDPDIVEFCLRLPPHLRTRAGQSKWILRQVLRRYLPEHLIRTDKKGLAVPLGQWLRALENGLRPAEESLPRWLLRDVIRKNCASSMAGSMTVTEGCGMCSCSRPGSEGRC
jgi:asparagine synthase (glutamine-hydrolysing)